MSDIESNNTDPNKKFSKNHHFVLEMKKVWASQSRTQRRRRHRGFNSQQDCEKPLGLPENLRTIRYELMELVPILDHSQMTNIEIFAAITITNSMGDNGRDLKILFQMSLMLRYIFDPTQFIVKCTEGTLALGDLGGSFVTHLRTIDMEEFIQKIRDNLRGSV